VHIGGAKSIRLDDYVSATIAVPLVDVLDMGFGRRGSRRKIAP
jgi:hypothetical protein